MAYAPRRHQLAPARFYDFSGGLNLSAGIYALEDNELLVCVNFSMDNKGCLTKRKGVHRVNHAQITGYQDSL